MTLAGDLVVAWPARLTHDLPRIDGRYLHEAPTISYAYSKCLRRGDFKQAMAGHEYRTEMALEEASKRASRLND